MKFLHFSLPLLFLTGFLHFALADDPAIIFKLGERFFDDSLYGLAQEQYEKYLDVKGVNQFDPESRFKISRAYFGQEEFRKAAENFEEYIKLYPSRTNLSDALYLAAVSRRKIGDLTEASNHFFSVWSRFSGNERAQKSLFDAAQCSENARDLVRAIELYHQYFTRFKKSDEAKQASLSLAMLYVDTDNFDRAERILDKAYSFWKNESVFVVRLYYCRAILFQKQRNTAKAALYYEKIDSIGIVSFPEVEEAYTAYCNILIYQKKLKVAHNIFAKLSDIHMSKGGALSYSFLLSWADNARAAKLYTEACQLYNQILDKYPNKLNRMNVLYRLAESYVGVADFTRAIETLRAIEVEDTTGKYSSRAILKTGDLYLGKGLFLSAISSYRRYLQNDAADNRDYILYKIGRIYLEKYGRYNAALREFDNLLRWYPASSYYMKTLFEAAKCLEKNGEYESAIRNYDYLSESGSSKKLVNEARKRAQYLKKYRMKDLERGLYDLLELVKKKPESITEFHRIYTVAQIYEKNLKNLTEALELYKKLELSKPFPPDTILANIALRKAEIMQKLYEKARYDNSDNMAKHFRSGSIAEYKKIISLYGFSSYADRAAYALVMLTSPNIAEYEQFIKDYPTSSYLAEVYLKIATHYENRAIKVDKGFRKKALVAYKMIFNNFPGSKFAPDAVAGLSRNFFALLEYDSAKIYTDTFFVRFSQTLYDSEILYIKGNVLFQRGSNKEAINIFKQVLYQYPFSVYAGHARYALGCAEMKLKNYFNALENFRHYKQNYGDGKFIIYSDYGIAKALFSINKKKEALELFDVLIKKDNLPKDLNGEIHFLLAQVSEDTGSVYDAIHHYKKALEIKSFSDKRSVHIKLGQLYFDSRVYDESAASYKDAYNYALDENDSAVILSSRIVSIIMHGDKKGADKLIKNFKELFGGNQNLFAKIIYYEGLQLLVIKEYDKAFNRFKYLAEKFNLTEYNDDANYQMALSIYYSNKIDESLVAFRKFIDAFPTSTFMPLVYFKIAMIFHGKNDFIRSSEYFSKTINHNHTDNRTRFRAATNAAIAYQKSSSWFDAAKMYDLVIKDYSSEIDTAEYHLKTGFCYVQASKIKDALHHFIMASHSPRKEDEPEIIYWIGTCYSRLGEYHKAIAEYLKVPYLYAGSGKWGITAEFETARIYERLGEFSKAKSFYQKIVRSDGETGRFGKKALLRIQRLMSLDPERE